MIVLGLGWIAGSLLRAAQFARDVLHAARLRQCAFPVDGSSIAAVLGQWDGIWGVPRPLPRVRRSRLITSPISVGLWRPLVLVPEGLEDVLSPRQLRDVLLHEFAHVRRRDHWVGLVQELAAVVFWPNPAVRWLNAALSRAREDVCDNYVLAVESPAEYARTLVTLAESLTGPLRHHSQLTLGVFQGTRVSGERVTLEGRVLGLMDQKRNPMKRSNKLFVAVAALSLGAAVVLVPVPNAVRAADASDLKAALTGPGVGAVVRQMEGELNEVGKKPDPEALAKLFARYTASDLTVVGGDGLADKAAFIELVRWKNPEDRTIGFKRDDTTLRQFGDAAVETGRYIIQLGSPTRTETRQYTAVWALREGKWSIVHLQFSEPVPGDVEASKPEKAR